MDRRINHPRIVNFRWNIKGNLSAFSKRFWCFISSRICKERILALLFFVLEVVSVVLDLIGKNRVDFLLAALLLSVFGFAITLCSLIEARTDPTIKAEIQIKVVEIVFSLIQLIFTFIQYLLTVLKAKNDYNASAFPLAFAIIAVVFVFIKDGKITDSSTELLPRANFQPIGSMTSTPIVLNQIVSSTNQVRSESSKNHVKLGSSKSHDKPESSTNQVRPESSPNQVKLGSSKNHDKPESSTKQVEPGSSTVKRSTHALSKKVVMTFEINDDEAKEIAMGTFSDFSGVDSIFMDMKNNIWTVIGKIVEEDVIKLSKICKTEQFSVEEKKDEKKEFELVKAYQSYNPSWISAKPERRKKPIGSMTSTPVEHNQIVSSTNQVEPGSSTVKRSTHALNKKVVMKLEINDDEAKKKAMETVVDTSGVDSFSMDMKNNELTMEGNIVAEDVVIKLRKKCKTELVSVELAKAPEEKKKEERTEDLAQLEKYCMAYYTSYEELPQLPKLYNAEKKKEVPDKERTENIAELQPLKSYQAYDIPPYKNPYYHIKSE